MMCSTTVRAVLLLMITTVRSQYVQTSDFKTEYKVQKLVADWDDAKELCHNEHGMMSSPINDEILNITFRLINDTETEQDVYYYTGIRYQDDTGEYRSLDGVNLNDMTDNLFRMIERLDPFEGECLIMSRRHVVAAPCWARLPFICHREVRTTTTYTVPLWVLSTEAGAVFTFSTTSTTLRYPAVTQGYYSNRIVWARVSKANMSGVEARAIVGGWHEDGRNLYIARGYYLQQGFVDMATRRVFGDQQFNRTAHEIRDNNECFLVATYIDPSWISWYHVHCDDVELPPTRILVDFHKQRSADLFLARIHKGKFCYPCAANWQKIAVATYKGGFVENGVRNNNDKVEFLVQTYIIAEPSFNG